MRIQRLQSKKRVSLHAVKLTISSASNRVRKPGWLWTDSQMAEHTGFENNIRVGAELKEANSQGKNVIKI